jgi:hypothetical protein
MTKRYRLFEEFRNAQQHPDNKWSPSGWWYWFENPKETLPKHLLAQCIVKLNKTTLKIVLDILAGKPVISQEMGWFLLSFGYYNAPKGTTSTRRPRRYKTDNKNIFYIIHKNDWIMEVIHKNDWIMEGF